MPYVVVVTPPGEILPLEDVKLHLRVDHAFEDDLIGGLIQAAVATLDGPDGWLGRALGEQRLELRGNGFPVSCDGSIQLPLQPSVLVSVSYDDVAGSAQVVDPSDCKLHGASVYARSGFSWPSTANRPDSVRIQYDAGTNDVPKPVLAALKLMIGDLYRWRDTTAPIAVAPVPMSTTVEALLAPLRVWR